MAKNLTLYIRDEDEAVVKRAMKLLAFHDEKSLSAFVVKQCRAIVKRYDSNDEVTK